MADNVLTEAVGVAGVTLATDEEVGVAHHPYTKLEWGANNVFNKVDSGAAALPIQDGGNSITVDGPLTDAQLRATPVSVADGGGSLTVDGPLTDAQLRATPVPVDQTEAASLDYDTGAGTVNQTVMGLALPGAGGPVAGGTATNPVRTDPTGTTTQPVSGPLTDAQLRATPVPVSGTVSVVEPVSVDDNGGSLTVDGTVSISGAVDTELPAAAALADDMANPTAPAVGAHVMGFDGTTWDRMRGDVANGLDVDVTRLPALVAGTANIGDVDVLTLPPLVAGTANIGDVDVASMPTGASAAQVQGTVAHDAAVAQNPVQVAVRANANEPTAVADGDVTHLWADLLGRLVVVAGHPSPEAPVSVNATASGETTIIAAPGASLSLYICKGSVHNRAATNRLVALKDGAAGTIRFRAELASEGGGTLFDFGSRGWKLTANTLLSLNLDAAGDVDVNVTSYYIAP